MLAYHLASENLYRIHVVSDAECTCFFRHKAWSQNISIRESVYELGVARGAAFEMVQKCFTCEKIFCTCILSGLSEVASGFRNSSEWLRSQGSGCCEAIRRRLEILARDGVLGSVPNAVACSLANHTTPSLISFLYFAWSWVRRLTIFSTMAPTITSVFSPGAPYRGEHLLCSLFCFVYHLVYIRI